MNNELSDLFKNISSNEINLFLKNTDSKLDIKEFANNYKVDYSWIDKVDKLLPYVEEIINNPIDLKILDEDNKNMFEVEAIDLYENRFVCSLINNLYNFITRKLAILSKISLNKQEKVVKYKANTRYDNKDIKIDLKLECEDILDTNQLFLKNNERIIYFKEKLEELKSSSFMKNMADVTPVRSPIKKTKIITNETNYIKSLELWELLENTQNEELMQDTYQNDSINVKDYENYYNLIYYLGYNGLNGKENANKLTESNLITILLDYAKRYDVDENSLRKEIEQELNSASLYKKEQKKLIIDAYHNFILEHENKIKKAMLLFK